MKRCAYCGTEYSDNTTSCPIDRQPLNAGGVMPSTEEPEDIPPANAVAHETFLLYPDYRWSARDAWKCLGMFLVFSILWYSVTGASYRLFPHFYTWRWGPFGVVTMDLIYAGWWILTAAYFARTESFASFCQATGLDRKPSNYVWLGIVAVLGIRVLDHLVFTLHLARSYPNDEIAASKATVGPERYLFLFPLLFAPFWEEAVNRGFLYKAFRGSYSVPVATALILAWTAYIHWDQFHHFGWAVISVTTLMAVQCYLREKSDSLWDCIWSHLVYNASGLLLSGALG